MTARPMAVLCLSAPRRTTTSDVRLAIPDQGPLPAGLAGAGTAVVDVLVNGVVVVVAWEANEAKICLDSASICEALAVEVTTSSVWCTNVTKLVTVPPWVWAE